MPNLYEQAVDGVFKALSDGHRRAILERLAGGESTLSALAEPLAISLPAVHQHVGVLEAAGLVASRKRGRERLCRIEARGLRTAERWIKGRREGWERRLDALDAYLTAKKPHARRTRR